MKKVKIKQAKTDADYLRDCYRGSSAYADSVSEDRLQSVHVRSPLDDQILLAVKESKDVVLTGNPGDGKTHLLRVLATAIEKCAKRKGVVIELDASQLRNEEIIARWKSARKKNLPFCIAINEGVLKDLADAYPSFDPVCAAQAQVENAIQYITTKEGKPDETSASVCVFDLSRRNILSGDFVSKVFDALGILAAKGASPLLANGDNDFQHHLQVLKSPLFRERLQKLFDQVAQRGFHATLRDVQAFVSYLLFRGVEDVDLVRSSGESATFITELVFKGDGKLFEELRRVFDPGKVSHPTWDERLIAAEVTETGWAPDWAEEVHSINPSAIPDVCSRRRRFYFLHTEGEAYFGLSEDLSSLFSKFLKSNERDCIRELLQGVNAAFRTKQDSDRMRVWEAHHFDHSIDRIMYSSIALERRDFEIVCPQLSSPMREAFEIANDHVVLRAKSNNVARLLVDYRMFELLSQARRGVPVLHLRNQLTRRLWQFMGQLSRVSHTGSSDEVEVTILDTRDGSELSVIVDKENNQYFTVRAE